MSDITTDRLLEMVTEALERTCFMVSDPSDAQTAVEKGYSFAHSARIAYAGPSAGHVRVTASDGFLEELASSLLGCEPEDIDMAVEGQDAIKELANIMGGSVILELGGDECEYRLGLPEQTDQAGAGVGAQCVIESTFGALRVDWIPSTNANAKAA